MQALCLLLASPCLFGPRPLRRRRQGQHQGALLLYGVPKGAEPLQKWKSALTRATRLSNKVRSQRSLDFEGVRVVTYLMRSGRRFGH